MPLSVIPYCIAFSAQLKRYFCLHFQRFFSVFKGSDMIIKTRPQIHPVLFYDRRGKIMSFSVSITCFMLLKTFFRAFGSHTNIEAL